MAVIALVQLVAVIVFWRVRKPSDDKQDAQGAAA
jgi:hypothetical protein